MEQRMPIVREKYIDYMRENKQLRHMSVSKFDWRSGEEHYFLAHHAVFKTLNAKISNLIIDVDYYCVLLFSTIAFPLKILARKANRAKSIFGVHLMDHGFFKDYSKSI